jgi:hypothetical protein
MIPKKEAYSSDPSKYRPISLTSCLGKLYERCIVVRLVSYLETNKLLSNYQSGFRNRRSTSDNLLFLTQKIRESFNRKKNALTIFFDIAKAFDKVWHQGILYKMHEMGLPEYFIDWTEEFLSQRKFFVQVDDQNSELVPIKARVPQGSVISPVPFSIFINNIPKKKSSNEQFSLLYTDDLSTSFIFKKSGNLEKTVNNYLEEIVSWLNQWKLKMSAHKCQHIIFTQNRKLNLELNLLLDGKKSPWERTRPSLELLSTNT